MTMQSPPGRTPRVTLKNAGIGVLVVTALIAIVAFLTGGTSASVETTGGGDGSDGTTATSAPPAEFDWNILVLKTTTVNCEQSVKDAGLPMDETGNYVKLHVASLDSVPPRFTTDSISTPFAEVNDPVKARDELLVNICRDPHLGFAWANTLANWSPMGHNVGDLNTDWLAQYKGDPSQIKGWTEQVILYEGTSYTAEQQQAAVAKYSEYETLAEKIGTLLKLLSPAIEQARAAESNLHLDPLDLVVGKIRNIVANANGDSLPALVMAITQKEVCGDLGAVGANLQDKRPEVFAANTCAPPPAAPETPAAQPAAATSETPAPGTPESPAPECVTDCGGTPECVTDCGGTPECVTDCGPPPCVTDCGPPTTNPPTTKSCCPDPAEASQPVPTPATQDHQPPTQEPVAQPTLPLATHDPAPPTSGGYNGGSTSNPITSGPPAVAETQTHASEIPTPTGGPFAGGS